MFVVFILYDVSIYIFLFINSKALWRKVIPYIIYILLSLIFILIYAYINAKISGPLLCDHVGDLRNGTIARTPLLQPGQTIKNLAHGTYNVTGGLVQIGNLGGGIVTKVIGIAPNSNIPVPLTYTPGTQPFNGNFASILFELREAGQRTVSHSALDYIFANRQLATPAGNFNAHYLQSYRVFAGMPLSQYGETSISNSIINGIAL